jgi:hypothetical protein
VARTDAGGRLINRTRYEPYAAIAAGVTPLIGSTEDVRSIVGGKYNEG